MRFRSNCASAFSLHDLLRSIDTDKESIKMNYSKVATVYQGMKQNISTKRRVAFSGKIMYNDKRSPFEGLL